MSTDQDTPGEVIVEHLPQYLQPVVRQAPDWAAIPQELAEELSADGQIGMLRFGSPAHDLGEVVYRQMPARPSTPDGALLYRRVS